MIRVLERFNLVMLGVLPTLNVFIQGADLKWAMELYYLLIVATLATSILVLLGREYYLTALFSVYSAAVFATVLIQNDLLDKPFDSWRAWYIGVDEMKRTLYYLSNTLYFTILLNAITPHVIAWIETAKPRPAYVETEPNFSPLSLGVLSLAALGIGFISIYMFGTVARNELAQSSDQSDMALYNLCIYFELFAVVLLLEGSSGRMGTVAVMVGVLSLLAIGFSGLRSALLLLGTSLALRWLLRTRWSYKFIVYSVPPAIVAYFLMTVIGVQRHLDCSTLEALQLTLAGGGAQTSSASDFAGSNERTHFYTLFYFTERKYLCFRGMAYVQSIIRLLPRAIYSLFGAIRINDVIAEEALPPHLFSTNLNLGAYFLTEAVLNFGRWGPYFVLPMIYAGMIYAEIARLRSYFGRFMYIVACANMITFVFYGLNGFAKPLLYTALFYGAVYCLSALISPATKLRTSPALAMRR